MQTAQCCFGKRNNHPLVPSTMRVGHCKCRKESKTCSSWHNDWGTAPVKGKWLTEAGKALPHWSFKSWTKRALPSVSTTAPLKTKGFRKSVQDLTRNALQVCAHVARQMYLYARRIASNKERLPVWDVCNRCSNCHQDWMNEWCTAALPGEARQCSRIFWGFSGTTLGDRHSAWGSMSKWDPQKIEATCFLSMATAEPPRFMSVLRPMPSIKTNRSMRLGSTCKQIQGQMVFKVTRLLNDWKWKSHRGQYLSNPSPHTAFISYHALMLHLKSGNAVNTLNYAWERRAINRELIKNHKPEAHHGRT